MDRGPRILSHKCLQCEHIIDVNKNTQGSVEGKTRESWLKACMKDELLRGKACENRFRQQYRKTVACYVEHG